MPEYDIPSFGESDNTEPEAQPTDPVLEEFETEYDIPDLGTGDDDGELNIPDIVGGGEDDVSFEGGLEMPLFDQMHEQAMAQLAQVGVVAQSNFTTVAKVFDYDHIENKRIVDLTEALGAREVSPGPYALKTGN